MVQVFLGEFRHTVDTQRRVTLPKEWRGDDAGGEVFYLLPGRDQTVQLLPAGYFEEEVAARLRRFSFANPGASRTAADLGSQAARCRCDRQGRITVPQRLLEHAGIKDQVVLVGAVLTAQVVAADTWDEVERDVETTLDAVQALQEKDGP